MPEGVGGRGKLLRASVSPQVKSSPAGDARDDLQLGNRGLCWVLSPRYQARLGRDWQALPPLPAP